MKTLNLELSKKLAPYLEEVETEYNWCFDYNWKYYIANSNKIEWIKTLTLEEAIEFLPKRYKPLYEKDKYYVCKMVILDTWYCFEICDEFTWKIDKTFCWKTLLEAIEKMIEHLIDNNFLELWD